MIRGSEWKEILSELGPCHLNSTKSLETVRTHKWVPQQLDHIWVSESLVQEIMGFGFLPFDYSLESDHRGVYVDIGIRTSEPPPKKNANSLFKKLKVFERFL